MRGLFQPPAETWRRNLYALRVTGFTAYLGFVFASPLLPLYLRDLSGGDVAQVAFWSGVAFSVSPLLGAITGPFWGRVADRFGPKLMLQRSLLAIGVAMALTGLATAVLHVVLLRALIGVLGGFTVASIAAVSASAPKRELSSALGSFQAAQTLGLVAGPVVGGLLADTVGARAAFFVSGLCFLPAIAIVQRYYVDIPPGTLDPEESGDGGPPPRASLLGMVRGAPPLLLAMGALYGVNFAEAALGPLMPLYLAATGAPAEGLATIAGATVSGASLGAAASAYLIGRAGARFGPWRALTVLLAVGAAMSLALTLAGAWWQLAAARVLLGLAVGGGPTLAYAAAAGSVPGTQRGAALGTVSSAGLLGYASGPLVAGAVARVALDAVFVVNAAIYLAAASALLLAGRRAATAARGSGRDG